MSSVSLTDYCNFILDSMEEDIVVLDINKKIVFANYRIRSRFENENIIGKECCEIVHKRLSPCYSSGGE